MRLRRLLVLATTGTLLALLALPVQAKNEDQRNFVAPLAGGNEVPAVDSAGTGVAVFQLSADGSELGYRLNVANLDGVTQSHIHVGAPGANGPVVAFLFGFDSDGASPNGRLAEGTITSADLIGPLAGATIADLADVLRSGGAYVNVHTFDNPPGEIRGQIG